MNITFPIIAGLVAAVFHVITGPDHIAAVTPFAIESKKKAWKIGFFWGIGHLVGMLCIGVLFTLFKTLIPVDKISNYSEQLVGIVLIGIGVWAFYKFFKAEQIDKHPREHNEKNVAPIHNHGLFHIHFHQPRHSENLNQSYFASSSIGFLHGLAGIAHFLLFIPILVFDKPSDSFLYIGGFGIGILLAMTAFAFVVGKIATFTKNVHNEVFFKGIRLIGGFFAIVIGVYWIFTT